jgi:alpha-tubulin suppressor-like RCC1 family protein
VAVAAGWAHSMALRADATVVAWGNDDFGQTDVSYLALNVVAVAAGYYHNIALRSDGTVVTWGWDVPSPVEATNVVAVAAGWQHCLALRADGSVIAWGDNTYGETTVPAAATNVVAVAAGWYHNLALRADGALIAWGTGANGVTNVPAALSNVASIAAGEDYSAAPAGTGLPRFSSQLASVVAHIGSGAVLRANVQGAGPLTLQWYHNGEAVSGATNQFLWLPGCQPGDAGNYVLAATNALGQAASQPVNLAVHTDPVTIFAVGGWGDNTSGQCAVSQGAVNPRAIAAGAFHALALNVDGTVAAWGKNWDGQTNVPPAATNVVAIAAGGNHSLALEGDGSVLAWGRNWDGQTNVPPSATNAVAVAAGSAHSVSLRADGAVVAWGSNEFGQTNVPAFTQPVVAIAAGYYHNLALLADHTVVAWGLMNTVPASATNVVALAGGWWHSLALRADGTIVAWGDNSYGQCTVPRSATNVVGIAAGYSHNLAWLADGTVLAWGTGYYGATNVPTGLGNVACVAAGQNYSLVMLELGPPRFSSAPEALVSHDGGKALFVAGVSGTSPLALQWLHGGAAIEGATSRCLLLTNVSLSDSGAYTLVATNLTDLTNSLDSSLAVRSDPAIGGNPSPQNVLIGTHVCLPAEVTGTEPVSLQWRLNRVDLQDGPRLTGTTSRVLCIDNANTGESGSYSLVASNASGAVTGLVAQVSVSPILAWGDNSAQQLTVPAGAASVVTIAAGGDHSLALRADDTIVPWGDNSSGQSNVPQSASNVVTVVDGGSHTLALRSDGTVVAWGDSTYGQTTVPAPAASAVAIAAGASHSLALGPDGTVAAWGSNASGQQTVPASATNVLAIAAGDGFSLAVRSDGAVVEWGALPLAPTAATNVVAIAAGARHALALRADGALIAWGGNYFGQASVPASATNVVAIAAGGDNSLALRGDGTVVCWGADYLGQASAPASATNVLAISAGAAHSLALVCNGTQRPSLPPFSNAAMIGQSVLLDAGSLMGTVASYQWQLNGMDLPGATNMALTIPFATWTNTGTYRVVASNSFGSVAGPPIVLTVLRTSLQFDSSPGGILLSNDGAHLRVLGASGVGPVVLLASSDLLAWEAIQTNPPVIGSVQFVDAAGSKGARRFYRAFEGTVAGPVRIDIATPLALASNGAAPLRVSGLTAEGSVIIYASSNLLNWSAIFTNPPTVGPLQYLEGLSTVQPPRFYRAAEDRGP